MTKTNWKRRVFDIIQIGSDEDLPSRTFDIVLVAAIVLNILVLFLETFDALAPWQGVFNVIEIVTVAIFCVEYALRIWTAEYLYPGVSRGRAVGKFLLSYDGVIDLLTILPFFFLSGFVVFRMLRVVRIFHLFRINPKYDSFNVIKSVLYEKRNQLASSVFIILILMLAASLSMYSAEHEAQPDAFENAFSAVWWSVSTLLTVGYGDIYPVTVVGRVMAVLITFLGVGAVAIPTGIISAGFVEQYSKLQQEAPRLTGELTAITLTMDSAWIDKTVADVEKEYHVDVVLVRRKGKVSAPKQHYALQEGDEVAYL
ncbi:MAG: ion transporter [Oscillospiraceae bacterium]|nr:ion transporter [Oscillospiraceae bacterium]